MALPVRAGMAEWPAGAAGPQRLRGLIEARSRRPPCCGRGGLGERVAAGREDRDRAAVVVGAEAAARAPRSREPQARSAPTADRARTVVYAPDLDGAADPGEIVWAWVPFEEGDGRGKDRPLLVVGRGAGDQAAPTCSG